MEVRLRLRVMIDGLLRPSGSQFLLRQLNQNMPPPAVRFTSEMQNLKPERLFYLTLSCCCLVLWHLTCLFMLEFLPIFFLHFS